MVLGMTTLGLPDSTEQSTAFVIFDNSCKIVGIWGPGTDTCGTPWTINAGFLKYELIIKSVDMIIGGGSYTFDYAGGEYSIGNNHCVCHTLGASFPGAAQACSCAFPVDGKGSK
ncbi:MAG: hypothetical protein MMC23_008558 [Stictis urceolatum]|nr:hypothetical protein [Stictis urceolata]